MCPLPSALYAKTGNISLSKLKYAIRIPEDTFTGKPFVTIPKRDRVVSMDSDLARFSVEEASRLGASYAEARIHAIQETVGLLRNGYPEPAVLADHFGLSIRIVVDGAMAFAASNVLTKDRVRAMVERALGKANSSKRLRQSVSFSPGNAGLGKWSVEEKHRLEDVGVDEMLDLLKQFDSLIKDGAREVAFPKRLLVLSKSREQKVYVNSEGADIESIVPRVMFYSTISATYGAEVSTITIPPGYAQLGETGGWEVVERLNLHKRLPDDAKVLAEAVKSREKPPSGIIDVILGPSVTGLVAHESCGHPQEADRILGREAAQAGESYLKKNDLGLKIGSDEAFVSDDPTIPHSMGFYLHDDEGVPARKRRLIDAGVIREFLHNRETAFEFNIQSNGSARACQFDREPIVRMANTYVEPGNHSLEELFEGVRLGVYIKSFMEWNIDDVRLNERYVGLESYLVEKGKLKNTVRNPVLEITTPKLWGSIDARGKDLEFTTASCGKGDPMQGIPVWTGGPSIRLRGVSLGSR